MNEKVNIHRVFVPYQDGPDGTEVEISKRRGITWVESNNFIANIDQLKLLALKAQGWPNKKIERSLNYSNQTIRNKTVGLLNINEEKDSEKKHTSISELAIKAERLGILVPIAILGIESLANTPVLGESIIQLTPRMVEIMDLVSEGLSNKNIADKLSISIYMVRYYIENGVFVRLGIHDRYEAIDIILHKGTRQLDGTWISDLRQETDSNYPDII